MMKKMFLVLPMLLCMLTGVARANWEYDGEHIGDGYYQDDGRRFIILVRGGIAYGMAGIKNDIGTLNTAYYYDNGSIIPATVCGDSCDSYYEFLGFGNLGDLKTTKDFKSFSFTAGMAIGWVLPATPAWRFQIDWDYISESEYNVSPFVEGDLKLTDGDVPEITSIPWKTGSVQSKITTNVVTTMAIRDFYKGWAKPLRTFIPYAGFGLGYADTETVLNFADDYGDLSLMGELQNYGDLDSNDILQFYTSKKHSSNLAAVLTVGFSYGISESFFLDAGFRFIYLPQIKWALGNIDGTRTRDVFRAENILYTNFLFGFRWEF